jgi:mannose-1-phosphate guanylyltransferase
MGSHADDSMIRCGIVLAGDDGTRLRAFIHQLRGVPLPKQYVNFIGTRSMLKHTFDRVEKIIPARRLFTIVNKDHLNYKQARRQIKARPRGTVIIQPNNKDTAPSILLPLLRIYRRFPNSSVAIFPSDHFIQEEDLFALYVGLGLRLVEQDPSKVILLGAEPTEPEREYGYIVPRSSEASSEALTIQRVERFAEKPEPAAARQLYLSGALWNTMVVMAYSRTLLGLMNRIVPGLYGSLLEVLDALDDSEDDSEDAVLKNLYASLKPMNFSKLLLETLPVYEPGCLSVLPMAGVFWSDWGSPRRLMSVLEQTGYLTRLQGVPEHRLFKPGMES